MFYIIVGLWVIIWIIHLLATPRGRQRLTELAK